MAAPKAPSELEKVPVAAKLLPVPEELDGVVEPGFPVIAFVPADAARAGGLETAFYGASLVMLVMLSSVVVEIHK